MQLVGRLVTVCIVSILFRPALGTTRYHCVCGRLPCVPCSGGDCAAFSTIYANQNACNLRCVPFAYCGSNGLCNKCCGSGCPLTTLYAEPRECSANCPMFQDRFYCQSGKNPVCQNCSIAACSGATKTYAVDDCDNKCEVKYYCTAGSCQTCYSPDCPDHVELFTDPHECAEACQAHYYCNGDYCQPCYGTADQCPTPSFDDDDTCNEECVVCDYSQWSDWSHCTARCNGGVRRRTRILQNGPEEDCEELTQEVGCGQFPCPITCRVSAWSPWGKCRGKCGYGYQNRIRILTVPPMFGGICPAYHFTEQRSCKTGRHCSKNIELEMLNIFNSH